MSRKAKPLKVYVAVLTRGRPKMLDSLLGSWANLDVPRHCFVTFLVIENDNQDFSRHVVDRRADLFLSGNLRYVLEPELGIPFGRNRAAREAVLEGADVLLFVDDDEITARDWLVKMIEAYRDNDAVLLGAPLRSTAPGDQLSIAQRCMYDNVQARYRKKELRAARLSSSGKVAKVTIVTNNWLADTSIFRHHRIWFDESMRFTGGTDAKLCSEVRKAGLQTAWVKDAFVYETIPPERLTFGYQYQRARDQSNANFARKRQGVWRIALTLLELPYKALFFLFLFAAIPFTGGRTLLPAARSMGWIAGRIGYLTGRRSILYLQVTGN